MVDNHHSPSQSQLDVLSRLLREQNWDELLITIREMREEFGDNAYLLYCEGKYFRNKEKFSDAIRAYQKALPLLGKTDLYFQIKKDLAIAFQQHGDLGIATSELQEVVCFYENEIDGQPSNVDARDLHFLELKKSLAAAVNSLGLTLRMHASLVYETGIFQTDQGERIKAPNKDEEGDKLVVLAAKSYQRALYIEHEIFNDRFPEYLNEFLRINDIMEEADNDDLAVNVSLRYRSDDLEYCLFLTNYLSLSLQLFGSDIDGFEQDYSALRNLYTLARAIMPDGHYYHQKLVGIQELADQAGLKFI